MNKFWVVLWHTYSSKVKTKSFITTTAIMLVLILALTNLTTIIGFFDDEKIDTVGVVDESGEYYEAFVEQLKVSQADVQAQYVESQQEGEKLVKDGELTGLLVIFNDEKDLPAGTYYSNTISDEWKHTQLLQALSSVKSTIVTQQYNLTSEQMAQIYEPASFEAVAIEENAKTAEELNQARGLVYVLLFVIYFAVIMYASMIATEVAGEKTSRVMEILISSVSPVQQMFGKILGIALVSLTQMLLFLGVGYYSIKNNLSDMQDGFFSVFGFGSTSVTTIVYAIVFTLLGYFLYATLAAFLGSLVSRVEDVQTMITPMTMLVVVGFMIAVFGLNNPDTGFITATSFIPFFSPMIMFLRIGMIEVPLWEIATSIALLVATIAALAVFGAKVYRGGVLMYGKGSSFKNIMKALDLTKK